MDYPEIDGIYKHYKGGKYQVISMAKHSETDETLVVYKSIHWGSYHVRPLESWNENVEETKSNAGIITSQHEKRFTLTNEVYGI